MKGFALSIDDFGTGYSSLKNLHDLPIDVLKIDQSFVGQIGKDWETTEIVRAIIELGNNLDIEIIAEGVSTDLQEQMLASQGCRLGQGYLLAPPSGAAEIEQLLRAEMNGPGEPAARLRPTSGNGRRRRASGRFVSVEDVTPSASSRPH